MATASILNKSGFVPARLSAVTSAKAKDPPRLIQDLHSCSRVTAATCATRHGQLDKLVFSFHLFLRRTIPSFPFPAFRFSSLLADGRT